MIFTNIIVIGEKKMNESEKMLPCPFCGGEAELTYNNDNKKRPYVKCKFGAFEKPKCPCYQPYQWSYKTEHEAISAWNKRDLVRGGE